jgi:aminopeptidase N
MAVTNPEPMKEIIYTNPVYPKYFADPFVWQHEGIYYVIGTGSAEAAGQVEKLYQRKVFPLLRSPDVW